MNEARFIEGSKNAPRNPGIISSELEMVSKMMRSEEAPSGVRERRDKLLKELLNSLNPLMNPVIQRTYKSKSRLGDPEKLFVWLTLQENDFEKRKEMMGEGDKSEFTDMKILENELAEIRRLIQKFEENYGPDQEKFGLVKQNAILRKYGFGERSLTVGERQSFEDAGVHIERPEEKLEAA